MKINLKVLGIGLTLFIIPIAINYFTDSFSWNDIWNNGWLIISLLLFFLLVLFFFPEKSQNNQVIIQEEEISKNDKITFLKIIDTLKLEDGHIQKILKDNYSNIPQDWNIHQRFHLFLDEKDSLMNHIVNKELNFFLDEFTNSLNDYLIKFSSVNDFDDKRNKVFVSLDIKKFDPKRYYEATQELDNLANIAWSKLKNLIAFSKEKDII